MSEKKSDLKKSVFDTTEEELDALAVSYAKTVEKLKDLNSQFPEVKKFLANRGLKHVRELDQQGMKDLVSHLTAIKDKLYSKK